MVEGTNKPGCCSGPSVGEGAVPSVPPHSEGKLFNSADEGIRRQTGSIKAVDTHDEMGRTMHVNFYSIKVTRPEALCAVASSKKECSTTRHLESPRV